jgi:hypothetical protein
VKEIGKNTQQAVLEELAKQAYIGKNCNRPCIGKNSQQAVSPPSRRGGRADLTMDRYLM